MGLAARLKRLGDEAARINAVISLACSALAAMVALGVLGTFNAESSDGQPTASESRILQPAANTDVGRTTTIRVLVGKEDSRAEGKDLVLAVLADKAYPHAESIVDPGTGEWTIHDLPIGDVNTPDGTPFTIVLALILSTDFAAVRAQYAAARSGDGTWPGIDHRVWRDMVDRGKLRDAVQVAR